VVIRRKIIHGTRSVQGLENHSVLRSLFETARRQTPSALTLLKDSTTSRVYELNYYDPFTVRILGLSLSRTLSGWVILP
jgi:hypothetical protein